MPQELLFELTGARVTPHIATFGGTSYQISNIGSGSRHARILRHNGVDIGKMDFLGPINWIDV